MIDQMKRELAQVTLELYHIDMQRKALKQKANDLMVGLNVLHSDSDTEGENGSISTD